MMNREWVKISIVMSVVSAWSVGTVYGQHADVIIGLDGNRLATVEGPIFESDIRKGVLSGGTVLRTDDPGFNTDSPGMAISADTAVGFNAVGPLLFWDDASMVWSATGDGVLKISELLGSGETTVTASTGVQAGFNFALSDVDGDIHQHILFELTDSGGGIPDFGAYAVGLELTSTVHETSEPFFILFDNNSIDFEMSVASFPEPASVVLVGLAGLLVSGSGRTGRMGVRGGWESR